MAANGRIPNSQLAPITKAQNGQQAYLRKDAAKAFNAMNSESVRVYGVTLKVSSSRTAYRTLSEQQYFWNLYRSGKGALAAVPGTSNHGWGLAVDLATQQMRSIVDKIGAKYGWAKKWSDAQSEWWHLKWLPGNYPAVTKATKASGAAALTKAERSQVSVLRRARTIAKRNGGWKKVGPEHLRNASKAKAWLQARVNVISKQNLNKYDRRERVRYMRAVIKG